MTEDEMARWYHRLDGHEFKQAPGVDDEQGSPEGRMRGGREAQEGGDICIHTAFHAVVETNTTL